jgi:hypothetical protein
MDKTKGVANAILDIAITEMCSRERIFTVDLHDRQSREIVRRRIAGVAD